MRCSALSSRYPSLPRLSRGSYAAPDHPLAAAPSTHPPRLSFPFSHPPSGWTSCSLLRLLLSLFHLLPSPFPSALVSLPLLQSRSPCPAEATCLSALCRREFEVSMHNTASSSTYVPIFTPTVNSRGPSIAPESSARAEQFRRLYDIYRICLQRGEQGRERADRAWSLLVRSGLLDWASNWRDGLDRVQLPGLPPLEHSSSSEGAGVTDSEGNPIPVEIDPEEIEERNSRRNELKTRFLRETLALHSRPAKRVHSLREPRAILLELVLHLISVGQYSAALNEIELWVSPSVVTVFRCRLTDRIFHSLALRLDTSLRPHIETTLHSISMLVCSAYTKHRWKWTA